MTAGSEFPSEPASTLETHLSMNEAIIGGMYSLPTLDDTCMTVIIFTGHPIYDRYDLVR
jgi:hypothetical protein